jgi:hypothetical protein
MLKHLMVFAVLLAMADSVPAKLKVNVVIDLSEEKFKNELQEAIEARINSTERYTIATSAGVAELLLSITCMTVEHEGGLRTGFVCNSDVTYFPFEKSALMVELEPAGNLVVGGPKSATFVANSLMNRFINGTTEEELASKKAFLRRSVALFCNSRPTDCKP